MLVSCSAKAPFALSPGLHAQHAEVTARPPYSVAPGSLSVRWSDSVRSSGSICLGSRSGGSLDSRTFSGDEIAWWNPGGMGGQEDGYAPDCPEVSDVDAQHTRCWP